MTVSNNCIELIKSFEGLRLEAYQDSAGVWTVGYGTTMYPDGRKVKKGDKITKEQAESYLLWNVNLKAGSVKAFVDKVVLNQNKIDAILSFTYNLGIGALQNSTLLKKLRKNPNDPTIHDEFLKWTKARIDGKLVELPGLRKRRLAESALYFKK